jgi:hypothetical protein
MILADVYVHGSDESVYEVGEKIGLSGSALDMFSHCADEVKLTFIVSEENGIATIARVNDRDIQGQKIPKDEVIPKCELCDSNCGWVSVSKRWNFKYCPECGRKL